MLVFIILFFCTGANINKVFKELLIANYPIKELHHAG